MICALCNKDIQRIEGHHLSYEPEKIMMLCIRCHRLLHLLNDFNKEKLPFVLTIINTYGQNWKNGREQYANSHYRKENRKRTHKEWMKCHPDKVSEYNTKYTLVHKEHIAKYKKEYDRRPEVKEKIATRRKIKYQQNKKRDDK